MDNQDIKPTDERGKPTESPEVAAPPAGSRDADLSDTPPPMSIPGRGPMDQGTPDVATGSTPVTRRDD